MTAMTQQMFDDLLTRFPAIEKTEATAPGLHLFHAPNSICSQKVRAVLAQLSVPFGSHVLDIFSGETYDPAYVRVRMAGCADAGLALADRHLGTTSVASSGCDGCVVPTMVNADTGAVTVDSLRICLEIDARQGQEATLVPDDLLADIMAELSIVDELPNYQNLAVQVVPASAPSNAFAKSKVARCEVLLARHGDDPVLRAAYEAKRSKEQSAADQLFEAASITSARVAVQQAMADLDQRLSKSAGPWLFGQRLTMADLFWGAELIRAEDVGFAVYWKNDLADVARYYEQLCALPALRRAILDFPGARLAKQNSARS